MEGTLVPLVAGLMVRNADPATAPYPPNVELRWRDVQPDEAGHLVTTTIDSALATGRPFRLRPMCGAYAPTWLCDRVATFTYVEHQSGRRFAVPRWCIRSTSPLVAPSSTRSGSTTADCPRCSWSGR